ncbi:PaaX family transcriptional regulator C-terminal domain-containing protein [Streptomyces sp. 796.1]|uniref:PaaX family transcriptional regulator C-terminal domain-containing protein n=1 Tax=Streptomyces sp. 796.1 TaxID=3163029 RepID=UPI0039C9EA84
MDQTQRAARRAGGTDRAGGRSGRRQADPTAPAIPTAPAGAPVLRPLTARSIVLSTLLGHHPAELPARALVRAGQVFGTADGTIRVALTRMVAAGDLEQRHGSYRLSARLLARQARQDDSRAPVLREWTGDWEIALVTGERRTVAERAALRQAMGTLRLAELREGSWLRPANLERPRPPAAAEQCAWLTGVPDDDPARLAARLWDLDGWAAQARWLLAALTAADTLAGRFEVAAAMVRQLLADPVLPAPLLPADWPGEELRAGYGAFEAEFRAAVWGGTG